MDIDAERRRHGAITVVVIETAGIGDRSYVVHDGEHAAVIDPQRDIDRILAVAEQEGVDIDVVVETHVHNDYVSGGLALARRTGAEIVVAVGSELSFETREITDGGSIQVGSFTLRALATPGHTHRHMSYVVADADGDQAVFTGGSMLIGTVGRTDLLGDDETDQLTRDQWRSVRRLIDEVADSTAVYPTHGFGSFCSSSGGADREHTTIAQEAADNIAATIDDVDRFVEQLLAGLTDHPTYYAHMSLVNRAGAFEPDLSEPALVEPAELAERLGAGEWVLDLRDRHAYAEQHLVGSAGFEVDGPFVTYVGWLIPWGARITLVGESTDQVARAQRELVRIGIDRPHGAAVGDLDGLATATTELASYPVADFAELAKQDAAVVVDVRRRDEWTGGHIEGAHHIAIHELLDHLHHVPDGQLWVHCGSGARAAIAASLLARAGHDVVLVDDSFENAEPAGLTVVEG